MLSRLLVPCMLAAGYGRIVNVSSSYKAQPGYGAHSVSKAALDALTRMMAQDLRGTGNLENAMDPGWVLTEMSPDGMRPPDSVVPLAIRPASLPARGATGREFAVSSRGENDGRG